MSIFCLSISAWEFLPWYGGWLPGVASVLFSTGWSPWRTWIFGIEWSTTPSTRPAWLCETSFGERKRNRAPTLGSPNAILSRWFNVCPSLVISCCQCTTRCQKSLEFEKFPLFKIELQGWRFVNTSFTKTWPCPWGAGWIRVRSEAPCKIFTSRCQRQPLRVSPTSGWISDLIIFIWEREDLCMVLLQSTVLHPNECAYNALSRHYTPFSDPLYSVSTFEVYFLHAPPMGLLSSSSTKSADYGRINRPINTVFV